MAEATLDIQSLGPLGDGAAVVSEGKIYVDRALPGERIKARLRPIHDGEPVPRADILEILTVSPHRQTPPCRHFDYCGGCTLQHVTPQFYREWKVDVVKAAFKRQGTFPKKWLEPVFLGTASRRRANFTAIKRQNKIIIGYYKRRSREVTDIDSCLVSDPKLFALREKMKIHLAPFLKEGVHTDLFLQFVGDQVDLVVIGNIQQKEMLETLAIALGVQRVSWRTYAQEEVEIIAGEEDIVATFGDLKVPLPPGAFLQPTQQGEEALVKAVMEALPEKGKFADLFAGCGTFTGPMLKRGPVDAFEGHPESAQALSAVADCFERELDGNPLRSEELNRYDAVVFDPPRAGCEAQARELAKSKVPTLVGISCNPATFARDCRIIVAGGYKLVSLQVFDQFLYSHHVEVVGVFKK